MKLSASDIPMIGSVIQAERPLADFRRPAVVLEHRMGNWGSEYAVLNGHPRNVSIRWYNWRDVEIAYRDAVRHDDNDYNVMRTLLAQRLAGCHKTPKEALVYNNFETLVRS